LKINIQKDIHEKRIIQSLSQLKSLNGAILFKEVLDMKKVPQKPKKEKTNKKEEENELNNQETLEFMNLYNQFQYIIQDKLKAKKVFREMKEHMQDVLTDLKINTENLKHNSLKQLHHLKAKYTLCDISTLLSSFLISSIL
jgi:hypothetical protein